MFSNHDLQTVHSEIGKKFPGEYILDLELLSIDEFKAHLSSQYGLQLVESQYKGKVTGFPLFHWDEELKNVYKTELEFTPTPPLSKTSPGQLSTYFGDQLTCSFLTELAAFQPAVARVKMRTEVYFTFFEDLSDLGQNPDQGFTFVEDLGKTRWLVPEKYWPGRILGNFKLLEHQTPYVNPNWELALTKLKLPKPLLDLDPFILMGEGSSTNPGQVCQAIYSYVVDWFFDDLPGDRKNYATPENVLEVVVKLANEDSYDELSYHDRYHNQEYSLNFYLYKVLDSLETREDGLTDMTDPDNQIAELAREYKQRTQRRFSQEQWVKRFDRG